MTLLENFRARYGSTGECHLLVQDGRILDCSARAPIFLARSREEILGQPPHHFFHLQKVGQAGEDPASPAASGVAGSFSTPGTYSCRCALGGGREIEAQLMVGELDLDAERGILLTIAERESVPPLPGRTRQGAEVEEEARKLTSLALMAGGIAHDFNNFLLAIMGNADLLDRDLQSGKSGGELLDEIRKAAGRAADLCNQLLSYSGKGQASIQPVDLSRTVREMLPMLKVAIPRRIALRLDLAENLPLVDGDHGQIHQMVMNLVVNASEAIGSDDGVITLATGVTACHCDQSPLCLFGDEITAANRAFLEVRDDGCGMDAATRSRIFDPYFSTKARGRGLGLTTVLGTVRTHQGSTCVSSVREEGTSFRICFPLTGMVEHPVVSHDARPFAAAGQGRILIVDDEEYLRLLCSRMLQRLGYSVILAMDGPQALEIYHEQRGLIDGVILDLEMPLMDGIEVLEQLLDFDPAARVIMTSGYHEREIATRFSGRGIAGFIQKPYVMSDLGQVLQEVINYSGK